MEKSLPPRTPFAAPPDVRFVGSVNGRYTLPSRTVGEPGNPQVIECKAMSLSANEIVLTAPTAPPVGENVVVMLEQLGMIKGHVTRQAGSSFQIAVDATPEQRGKLAAKINWLKKRQVNQASDLRNERRLKPRKSKAFLYVGDAEQDCLLIDMSLSGAAVAAAVRPAIGTEICVGTIAGKVVRHMDVGFGVQFTSPQSLETLEADLTSRRAQIAEQ